MAFWWPPRKRHVQDRGWFLFPLVILILLGRRVDYNVWDHLASVLPSSPQDAWFLKPIEEEVAILRLDEFYTPHGYLRCALAFCGGTLLTSNAIFLAMVEPWLGYDVVKTNLYTVAPTLVGAVLLVIWRKSSDYFRERGFHISSSAIISLTGYIILDTISTSNTAILYFAMFLCTIGAYPQTPIGLAWLLSNIPNLNTRGMTSGLHIAVGNCAELLSSNIHTQKEAPRYFTVLTTNISMSVILMFAGAAYGLWMRWENRRRDRKYGLGYLVTESVAGTRDPRFRFRFQV